MSVNNRARSGGIIAIYSQFSLIFFNMKVSVFCRGCVFAPLSHKILNMTRPKLSPRDIWRTLILACRRTLSPLAVWKIPMPKITLFFTGIPIVVTAIFIGVLDF